MSRFVLKTLKNHIAPWLGGHHGHGARWTRSMCVLLFWGRAPTVPIVKLHAALLFLLSCMGVCCVQKFVRMHGAHVGAEQIRPRRLGPFFGRFEPFLGRF